MKIKLSITFLSLSFLLISCNSNNGLNKTSNNINITTNTIKTTQSPTIKATPNIEETYSELLTSLNNVLKTHIQNGDKIESDKNVKNTFLILENSKARITEISNTQKVPKALIQSIIFYEQLHLQYSDLFADSIVENNYSSKTSATSNSKDLFKKDDSSTGLGQIFARTAIDAEININKSTLNSDNPEDVKNMWLKLQDNNENIYYVALVLKRKAKLVGKNISKASNEDIKRIFARYNGSGSDSTLYGNRVFDYYQVFNTLYK